MSLPQEVKEKLEQFGDVFSDEQLETMAISAMNAGKDPVKSIAPKARAKRTANEPDPSEMKVSKDPGEKDNDTKEARQAATLKDQQQESETAKADSNVAKVTREQQSRAMMGREARTATNGRPRRGQDRIPMHLRNLLTTEKRDGFARRWVNDKDDRLQAMLDAGWDFVYKGEVEQVGDAHHAGEASGQGSRVSKSVGDNITAYLMEIPEELYREDQAAKQRMVDATEADMVGEELKGHIGGSQENFHTRHDSGKPIESTPVKLE